MATTDAVSPEDIELDARALTECMTTERIAPGLFRVTSASGRSYTVEPALNACNCPDAEYRGRTCKHQRRAAFAAGQRDIPAWADADEIDSVLQRRREVLAGD